MTHRHIGIARTVISIKCGICKTYNAINVSVGSNRSIATDIHHSRGQLLVRYRDGGRSILRSPGSASSAQPKC